jgi:hypothetical protein
VWVWEGVSQHTVRCCSLTNSSTHKPTSVQYMANGYSTRDQAVHLIYFTSSRVEGKQTHTLRFQRHYRHRKRDSELQSTTPCVDRKCFLSFLICYPSQSLWSPCNLLLKDLERTDSSRLHYICHCSSQTVDVTFMFSRLLSSSWYDYITGKGHN